MSFVNTTVSEDVTQDIEEDTRQDNNTKQDNDTEDTKQDNNTDNDTDQDDTEISDKLIKNLESLPDPTPTTASAQCQAKLSEDLDNNEYIIVIQYYDQAKRFSEFYKNKFKVILNHKLDESDCDSSSCSDDGSDSDSYDSSYDSSDYESYDSTTDDESPTEEISPQYKKNNPYVISINDVYYKTLNLGLLKEESSNNGNETIYTWEFLSDHNKYKLPSELSHRLLQTSDKNNIISLLAHIYDNGVFDYVFCTDVLGNSLYMGIKEMPQRQS